MLTAAGAAKERPATKHCIKNFGSVNEGFYRGAQPERCDYAELASLGIRTVIDLQRQGEQDEQQLVEAVGMKFYRIPMSDKSAPATGQVEEFLKIVNDPANQPVFVHCRGGRHRTGAMTAIYRMTRDRWSADQAFQEMKAFDFDHGFGHGALKEFVYQYYSHMGKGIAVSTGDSK
jgi:protein tyrosine/serine phosphatase